jgi:hypothetical protein
MDKKAAWESYPLNKRYQGQEAVLVTPLGYLKMISLSPLTFFKRVFKKKVIFLLRFFDKRVSKRVRFQRPIRCQIYNLITGRFYYGWVEDISNGGLRVLSPASGLHGVTLKLSFYDPAVKRGMSIYVIPIAANVRRTFNNPRFQSLQEYRCPAHPDIRVPEQFQTFYQRVLSDSYVKDLNQKHMPVSVIAVGKKSVTLKVAQDKEEKEAAYRLVYKEYTKRGFADPNPHNMFTYRYQLLPETTTIVGVNEVQDVVMTISTIKDAAFGLPSDHMFKDVLDPLRRQGRTLIEFGMLSTQKSLFGKRTYSLKNYQKLSSLFFMFRMAVQHSLEVSKATDVIIAIPPKYQALYKYLGFEPLTELRYYDKYNTQALVMKLDLTKIFEPKYLRLCIMKFFFGHKVKEALEPSRLLTPAEANYLFVEKSDLIQRLSGEELDILYKHYPEMRFWLTPILEARQNEMALRFQEAKQR